MPNLKRKGIKGGTGYIKKNKKRKRFFGNQFSMTNDTSRVSTTAEKLRNAFDDVSVDPNSCYVLLNFLMVFNFLSATLKCKTCDGDVTFLKSSDRGLGFKLVIECGCRPRSVSSCALTGQSYEVNRRLMFVMRLLGIGQRGVNLFCGLMELSTGFGNSVYDAFLQNLYIASKAVFECVCRKAVQEEIKKNEQHGNTPTQLSVSGDGSWKRRGFSSLYGITSLIGTYSKKVLDCVVKSSYCQGCNLKKSCMGTPEYEEWLEQHAEECLLSHHGSSGKMEVDAVQEMFARSEELHGVQYKYYIGDGDTKTFKALLDMDPYSNLIVQKKECVGHVQKRMGTRLRAAKRQNKGIGGKGSGKLTDNLINELTVYYGLAIRRHAASIEEMKKAVWATLLHKSSTDKDPKHDNCPVGSDSWCKWQAAKAAGTLDKFHHDAPLTAKVQDVIRPIYEALSEDDLMERCLGGHTQNSNESFNACVWKLSPKHMNCGAKTVCIATYLATGVFNDGFSSVLKVMSILGIHVGPQAKAFQAKIDADRERRAEKRLTPAAREAHNRSREEHATRNKFFEEEEGILYGAGIAE